MIGQLKAQTAVHWYLPHMNAYQAQNCANYDIVIIDLENIFNNPKSIDILFERNPNLILLIYWNHVEIFNPMFKDKPWSQKMLAELKTRPKYWLKQADGKDVVFWTGMKMLNTTGYCPKEKGQTYREYVVELLTRLMDDPRYSGFFVDNLWPEINWMAQFGNNHSLDANLDGRNDAPGALNSSFQREMTQLLKDMHQIIGPDRFILANPGNTAYLNLVDGKQFENFPDINMGSTINDGWDINMAQADNGKKYNTFNARTDNLFYTICSAKLLDNIYVSYKQNTLWSADMKIDLGKALKKKVKIGSVYKREYEQGTVYVYPKLGTAKIIYKNGFIRTDPNAKKQKAKQTKLRPNKPKKK